MAKEFGNLKAQLSPAARAEADRKTEEMLREMPLMELRQARNLSQAQIADVLHVRQAAVSKLERRTDMYISSLRRFIQAAGGELEIRAKFPDGVVLIDQFETVGMPISAEDDDQRPVDRGGIADGATLSPA